MSFTKFQEYLNSKSDLQKKATVDGRADTGPSGSASPKPPKAATKGKNWKNFEVEEGAQVDDNGNGAKNVPYSAPGTDPGLQHAANGKGEKSPVKGLYSDTLSSKGSKDLVYNPKTMDQALKMKKLRDTTPEDNKTESFLNKTRDMSPEDYASYILKQTNAKGIKNIIETVEIIAKDELLIEAFVREMKRKGDFQPLISAILSHPETYAEIAIRMANESHGKDIARKLAKAINEITAEPATDDIVPEKPASKKMPRNDDSINTRGQAVMPEMNARKAKTVKDIPAESDDILQSKMMRPEHNLIEALSNYKAIRATMKKLID
jgi:hypothetical protein